MQEMVPAHEVRVQWRVLTKKASELRVVVPAGRGIGPRRRLRPWWQVIDAGWPKQLGIDGVQVVGVGELCLGFQVWSRGDVVRHFDDLAGGAEPERGHRRPPGDPAVVLEQVRALGAAPEVPGGRRPVRPTLVVVAVATGCGHTGARGSVAVLIARFDEGLE